MRLYNYSLKRKIFATLALVIFFSSFLIIVPPTKRVAHALPAEITADIPLTTSEVRKKIFASIKSNTVYAAKIALGNAMLVFGQQVAYNAAIALAEYDNGEPFFDQLSPGKLISDAADKATGEFLDTTLTTIISQAGYEDFDICNPRMDLMLKFVLEVEKEVAPTEPRCTWSDLKKTYYGDESFYQDENFLSNFGFSLDMREHDVGQLNKFIEEHEAAKAEAKKAEEARQQLSNSIKADSASGQYKTPNFLVEEQAKYDLVRNPNTALWSATNPGSCSDIDDESGAKTAFCIVGKSSLLVFTNTFTNRLAKRLYTGFVNKFGSTLTLQHLSDWFKDFKTGFYSDFAFTGFGGSAQGGLLAAGSGFSDLATPTLVGGTGIDVIPRLSATDCTEDKEFDQCVITPDFGEAVLRKLTVREAIDEGYLSDGAIFGYKNGMGGSGLQEPEITEGIGYSAMLVLRKYRIIPVTWEIAAQYIGEHGNRSYTLGNMIDAYNDENSPFYRLVDPDWLLKAPVTQCARSGYTEDVYDESCFPVAQTRNDLMNPATSSSPACESVLGGEVQSSVTREYDDLNGDGQCDPDEDKKIDCSRKSVCVDQESCILEDDNGDCKEFGYCVAEKDIWRFGGVSCKEEYASCLSYRNTSTGEDAFYLRRTLSINDCSSDSSLGCRGYCQQDSETGEWLCDYDTSTGLSTVSSDVLMTSSPIFFNDNAQTCSQGDAGCQEFLRTVNNANLIANSDFSLIGQLSSANDGNSDDLIRDTFGSCDAASGPDLAGKGCYSDSNCGSGVCSFWTSSESSPRIYSVTFNGETWAQLQPELTSSDIHTQYSVETGSSLSERVFDISLAAFAPQNVCSAGPRAGLACSDSSYCQGVSCDTPNNTGSCKLTVDVVADAGLIFTQTFDLSSEPQRYQDMSFSVPSDVDVTDFELVLQNPSTVSGCNTLIDQVKVQEVEVGRNTGVYTSYASSIDNLSLAGSRSSCDAESVGCKLYTPKGGNLSIPGIVRSSDQCAEDNVGCKSYKEISTRDNFESIYAQRENAFRTGKYCENDYSVSCVNRGDCGGNACLPAVSLVVEKGDSCSAQEVGCEAFTNLDLGDNAEAVQYYSKIRPCVKPDTAICKPFFTWEGSLTTGFQLREYYLEEELGAPKFVPGANSLEEATLCNEAVFISGDDPNCQQFYDEDNVVYYARFDRTISCTNECSPLRNSFDNEVYMAAPSESMACRATSNGCKEYKGNSGNNQRVILDVKPYVSEASSGWTGDAGDMVVTSESISAQTQYGSLASSKPSEYSNQLVASPYIDGSEFTENRSYILSFWIKGSALNTDGIRIALEDTSGDIYPLADNFASTVAPKVVPSSSDWNEYTLGPVVLEDTDLNTENVRIRMDNISVSPGIYLSHIRLVENDSAYLIKGSAPTCKGDENCQTYNDGTGLDLHLKTFTRLCKEEYVGCEAVVNTANSDTPFAKSYTRPYGSDSTTAQNINVVPEDTIEFFVNNSDDYCSTSLQGCQELGLPQFTSAYELDAGTPFVSEYIVNDPDLYETTLCQRSEEFCDPYIHSKGGSESLKDPKQHWCQYKTNPNGSGNGWYKYGTDDPCPTRSVGIDRLAPAGQVCIKDGSVTAPVTPCSYVGDPVCSSLGATCEYWAGLCSADQDRCTEFVEGQTGEGYFQISDSNFIDTTSCSEVGVDPKQSCVAFRDISQDTLDLNSRKYCTSTIELGESYAQNASDGKDFYDAIRAGRDCKTDADCPSSGDTCDSLIGQYRQYASESCLECSTDYYSCNSSGNLPCCGTEEGICKSSSGDYLNVSCDLDTDCGGSATCEKPATWCNSNETIKVERDRVCDQWLTCSETSVIRDEYGKEVNVCLSREVCDEGEGGLCSKVAYSAPGNITVDMDIDFPKRTRSQNSETVSHMTGYSLAGIKFDDNEIIKGSYAYADMFEYSTNSAGIFVTNGDFEKKDGGHVAAPPSNWQVIREETDDPDVLGAPTAAILVKRTVDPDRFTNRYLSVSSLRQNTDAGVYTEFTDPSVFDVESGFITISFKARLAGDFSNVSEYREDFLRVRMESTSNLDIYMHHDEEPISINGLWNDYVVRLRNNGGDIAGQTALYLKFLIPQGVTANTTIELDDIKINPVLAVQELPSANVTSYAQALVEGLNYTNIVGIDQSIADYTKYGTPIKAVGNDTFNTQDDPFMILGVTHEKVSLGAPTPSSDCTNSSCHGRITVDFGAQILVDKEGENDLMVKEHGQRDDECYYVEIADELSDSAFKRIRPSEDQECVHQRGAFGGNGMEGQIDIATVNPDDGQAFRYVRVIDVSLSSGSHGGSSTSGTDIKWIKALSTISNSDYLSRSCRAYPTERAPSCDYIDQSSKVHYKGWEGYCVERHPTNPEWCINWWPIDVIAGSENVFSGGMQSLTPAPLYYCADTVEKPLPTPFNDGSDDGRVRYVCVADDWKTTPTCDYTLINFDTADPVSPTDCFEMPDQLGGLTPEAACTSSASCMPPADQDADGLSGNGYQIVCPLDSDITVTVAPLCEGDEDDRDGHKCSSIAVVQKPKAKAISLITVKPGFDGNATGVPNDAHPDKWALGVDEKPRYFKDNSRIPYCDLIDEDVCMEDKNKIACEDELNFNGLYCKDSLADCVNTLEEYYDNITIYQFRDDGGGADVCGNDNEGDNNKGCSDGGWFSGGSCYYGITDGRGDTDSCGEVDHWNNVDSFDNVDCGFNHSNYDGYDPQGTTWQNDELYPLVCSKIVQVVDENGKGLPYSSRIVGGLSAERTEASNVSSENGYDRTSSTDIVVPWTYAYSQSCTPYGAIPYITSLDDIKECIGYGIEYDGDEPATDCYVDGYSGNCRKRDESVSGACHWVSRQLEIYSPYNPENGQITASCSTTMQAGTSMAYNWDNSSKIDYSLCSAASQYPGVQCFVDEDCGTNGECVAMSHNEVGDKAIEAAVRRMQQLFAVSKGSWAWEGPSSSDVRGYNTIPPNSTELYAGGYTLDIDPDTTISWSAPTSKCPSNKRSSLDFYCYVEPEVSGISVNNVTAAKQISLAGDDKRIVLQYNLDIDPDQIPAEKISIDWGDGSRIKDNYEGTMQLRDYSCAETIVIRDEYGEREECSACSGDEALLLDGRCHYRRYPRITVTDSWGKESAEKRFPGTIIVGP